MRIEILSEAEDDLVAANQRPLKAGARVRVPYALPDCCFQGIYGASVNAHSVG